ncbi:MAG: PHP domain-containing protein [Clostridia bacterium]|nr:PHP domain-containing protein [Clostridia bacterium]
MIQDLHSHTYYSFCGKDRPEDIVEAAIAGGVELFGICDHNSGVGYGRRQLYKLPGEDPLADYEGTVRRYFDHINLIREKYADRIRILRGIEIYTGTERFRAALPDGVDISFFDYCLLEAIDQPEQSIAKGDLFAYAERCGCPVGVAHTDLFAFIQSIGEDPYRYFKRMAEQGIFWEMNVSYDSIHHYREHPYMLSFFEDAEQQAIVRESGVRLSVGFDGHRVEDYRPDRVRDACRRIGEMGIRLAFE